MFWINILHNYTTQEWLNTPIDEPKEGKFFRSNDNDLHILIEEGLANPNIKIGVIGWLLCRDVDGMIEESMVVIDQIDYFTLNEEGDLFLVGNDMLQYNMQHRYKDTAFYICLNDEI